MPYDTPELTEPEVLQHASITLHDHLPLHAEGYACTTDDLLRVLLGVAVNRGTIEAVCADLVGRPDPQTIRGYLNAQLRVEDLPDLERRLNAALAAELTSRVRRHAREVAIDYHDRPYYGKAPQAEGGCGSGARPKTVLPASTRWPRRIWCSMDCGSPWRCALFCPRMIR